MLSGVGDDYFGAPLTPPAGQPTGMPFSQGFPAASTPQPPSAGVSVSQSGLAAIGVAVAGLLMCLGAWGPWLRATGFGASLDYGGLHSDLDGKWIMALGLGTLVLGGLLYAMPSGHDLRSVAAVLAIIVGIVGLVIVVRQYVELSDKLSDINGVLGAYLRIHVESGWGLWLAGFGGAGAGATGFVSLVS
jgi:hypothetical protein